MNGKRIIVLIGVLLLLFVLFKVIIDQLCTPTPQNIVSTAVSDAVSNAVSAAGSNKETGAPDPFSWEPLARQILMFFSKACTR